MKTREELSVIDQADVGLDHIDMETTTKTFFVEIIVKL